MSKQSKREPEIILREHTFDGIQEYDQKLPNWWLFTLYIAIVIFILFWFSYYQLPFGMKSDTELIEAKIAKIDQKRDALLEKMVSSLSNESLQIMSGKPDIIEAGKAIFDAKCLACHGPDLTAKMGGIQLPGVSLVDEEWLHGSEPLQIMHIVTNGSPNVEKGMIAWKTQLSPTDIAQVVSYILSKQPGR